MKKTLLLVAATALLSVVPASAQSFSLYGSYWDTDAADDSFGGGAALSLGHTWALDLRGSYYQELNNHAFDNLFDDDEVFRDSGLEVLPLEIGVRYNFQPDESVNPHIGAGVGYYILDTDIGDPKDEVGYYISAGSSFGQSDGIGFFVEATYRKAEGTVEVDPEDLGDIDDTEFDGDEVNIDLDGWGVNAGIIWRW